VAADADAMAMALQMSEWPTMQRSNDPSGKAIHADDDDLVAKLRGGTLLKEAALASHLANGSLLD